MMTPRKTPTIPAGTLVVFGGASEIGGEIAQRLCPGRTVVLLGRNQQALGVTAERLRSAGADSVHTRVWDALTSDPSSVVASLRAEFPPLAVVVCAFGLLGDQQRGETEPQHAMDIVTVDYTAQVGLLTALAAQLRDQPQPSRIIAFSSIAGWRVRRANYIYGSAKAGLDGFVCGLSDALHGSQVQTLLVRPGFVIGRLTDGMSPAPLSQTPDQVADATVAALSAGASRVWVPKRLGLLATAMRLMPGWVWRRMPR